MIAPSTREKTNISHSSVVILEPVEFSVSFVRAWVKGFSFKIEFCFEKKN